MRWSIKSVAGGIFTKNVAGCKDDLEMATEQLAFVVTYGGEADGKLLLARQPIFPTLRLRPNDTHATFRCAVPDDCVPKLLVNGEPVAEEALEFAINGFLTVKSTAGALEFTRRFYPASTVRAGIEAVAVKNLGCAAVHLSTDAPATVRADSKRGCMGVCVCEVSHNIAPVTLEPGGERAFYICYTGRLANEPLPVVDADAEFAARIAQIERLTSPMRLETGSDELDLMFRFAKLRAGESVFRTKAGLLHSPGGYSYFAAVWCNDQVEYAGPYFAYTGDRALIEASENAYRLYEPFMDADYFRIPSSIIAEGVDYWDGVGDRGDAAMYVYGASHFALTCGDIEIAKRHFAAIKWAAEYCLRQKNESGVIASDSDELEGRFPSGSANLCTSVLCCDGLKCAAILARELGDPVADYYINEAKALETAIETYFGAEIRGHHSYKYYDGCDILRSWMCMPLCAGIFTRAAGTIDALTDPRLMTADGLLTAENSSTVWDRSTLYGLRGIFAAASRLDAKYGSEAAAQLKNYVGCRLLGERVPYAVEAYPEGGRRHLSGESALFCKIILEGILGIRPAGLRAFTFTPELPQGLEKFNLYGVKMHGASVDFEIDGGMNWRVLVDGCLYCSGNGSIETTVQL